MIKWIICMLQSYQILITGLIGFTGVIVTMLANAWFQRTQYERKIKHETNSLRAAIKSELNANKQALELRIKQLNEPTEYSDALIPSKSIDDIYKELINKIGLLTDEEIEMVIQAYALMAELPYSLRILVGTNNVGGFNNEFIRVSKDKQDIVLKMHEKNLPVINQAISAIEKYL